MQDCMARHDYGVEVFPSKEWSTGSEQVGTSSQQQLVSFNRKTV